MRSNAWLWRTLGLSMLICTIALLAGFGWAMKDTWFPASGMAIPDSQQPSASPAEGDLHSKPQLQVTAVGDSLTRGAGDTNGFGYVKGVTEALSAAFDKPVRLVNNLAINGLRADQLAKKLDDTGYRNAVGEADILLLTIGGNDLFQLATNGGSIAEGGDLSPELLEERLPEAKERLTAVFRKLRENNPHMRIVYIGLYNPFYDVAEMRRASGTIQKWNQMAHELAEADGNATVVPTYDLFEANIGAYLASDHFHPNAAGYARIAERVVQALR